MNTLQHIEKANYVATPDDVEKMAREQFEASQLQGRTHSTYFKILLACVQTEIAGKPTLRQGRGALPALDTDKHLEAFEAVNGRLYAAVIRGTVTPDIEPSDSLSTEEKNRRSMERNRRNTFARTAASTMRKFIRLGGDIRKIVVPTASKPAMASATPKGDSPNDDAIARARVKRAANRLATVVEELAADDRKLAAEALQEAMPEVAALLARMAGKPTDKPETAIADSRPFRTPEGVFWPMTPATH